MTRLQNRRFILAGCFLIWFMVGGVQTFTLFIAPWSREFGWSITAMSLAASVQLAVNGLFSPVGGKLADRFGAKQVVVVYILALGAGALGVGLMTSFWQLVLLQGVVFGVASGLSPVLSPLLARWFVQRRGMAFAAASSGHHLGRGAFAPVVVALMALGGWRAPWFLMAALILLVSLPFVLGTFRNSPAPEIQTRASSPTGSGSRMVTARGRRLGKRFTRLLSGSSLRAFLSADPRPSPSPSTWLRSQAKAGLGRQRRQPLWGSLASWLSSGS